MFEKEIVNRIIITEEARVDYHEIDKNAVLPLKDMADELSEYIDNMNKVGRLIWQNYFRVTYYDEGLDRMLMMFCYRNKVVDGIQKWHLQGICEEKDWSDEMEDSGQIRSWLTTSLYPTDEYDWVEDYNKRRVEELAYQEEIDKENKKCKRKRG
jgi:hypothetical protein